MCSGTKTECVLLNSVIRVWNKNCTTVKHTEVDVCGKVHDSEAESAPSSLKLIT